ncbi:hypothetical protein AXG93_773s1400 [Marchantia polymorpha subsp. ruderalis]|uniref:Uncharacterized protein n=1 Tax=Marchantia polymorpha subsp. ruderalis TaxID=1480154 RepID=A0A176W9V5_MARPO|nr:hypothetical protein AXG93_773s1400 [Marchantia polymorpha subsp. ruderalis]
MMKASVDVGSEIYRDFFTSPERKKTIEYGTKPSAPIIGKSKNAAGCPSHSGRAEGRHSRGGCSSHGKETRSDPEAAAAAANPPNESSVAGVRSGGGLSPALFFTTPSSQSTEAVLIERATRSLPLGPALGLSTLALRTLRLDHVAARQWPGREGKLYGCDTTDVHNVAPPTTLARRQAPFVAAWPLGI